MNSLEDLRKPLNAKDIDFRVQSMGKDKQGKVWCVILAYKDARVDTNRLNDVCGVDGWQSKYELIDGQLFCSVGVWSEKLNQFVWKQNVGTESNTEKEKGRASDAFKRACFSLGLGIELYEFPLLFCYLNEGEFYINEKKKDKFGNPTIQAGKKLRLNKWAWSVKKDGDSIFVTAQDDKGNVRVNAK